MIHHPHPPYQFPMSPAINSLPSVPSHHYRPRASSTRSTSISGPEFRGSTNPEEDWTKISDLAERRRIQNRIAQRNYRKKLKRRLEDLERRAASRSDSPNGEETDGRSTRESSSEGSVLSPPPALQQSLPALSAPSTPSPSSADGYLSSPTSPYSSAYPSHPSPYRSAVSPSSSASTYPPTSNDASYYYPPTTASAAAAASSPTQPSSAPVTPATTSATPPHYIYSYSSPPLTLSSIVDSTCSSNPSNENHSSYLPLPSARISLMSYAPASTNYKPGYEDSGSTGSNSHSSIAPFYLSYTSLAENPKNYYTGHYYEDNRNLSSPSSNQNQSQHPHYHAHSTQSLKQEH